MSTEPTQPGRRRVVLGAVGGLGAVGVASALTACGGSNDPTIPPEESAASSQLSSNGTLDVKASDIAVGGGVIVESAKVVVTQPAKGTFKAFSAICPHQGCVVAKIVDNVITCPCHTSTFNAETGAVLGGPSPSPLAPHQITVKGDTITLPSA